MARHCVVTGKKTSSGNKYAIRGIAKKKKGIGLKITGKTKRRFKPNLAKKRFWYPDENRFIRIPVSSNGMRTIEKKGISVVVREMRANGISV